MAALTETQARFFTERNFGHVATIRDDGTPHVSPVWIDYDGERVVFNTAVGRAKERHLRRDPRVTISVTEEGDPYKYIEVSGTAELTEEGADEHIDKMAKKYLDKDEYPFRSPGEERIVVRVVAEAVDWHRPRR